jgi:hypothetical protein
MERCGRRVRVLLLVQHGYLYEYCERDPDRRDSVRVPRNGLAQDTATYPSQAADNRCISRYL